jgi:DNA-binding NarL/FixJ family response regulator
VRVLIVSSQTLFARGMDEWLRQQAGVDIVGREADMACASRCIEHLQPDVVLLDIGDQARDPTAALMRFLRDGLDTQIVGLNLRDECISIYYKGHGVMQGAGDLLRAIEEAGHPARV